MINNTITIGKCSCCGGIVKKTFYSHYVGDQSTRPGVCESCGATQDVSSHLPVVPMQPQRTLPTTPGIRELKELFLHTTYC